MTFIFDRCCRSSPAVTPVKYECDSENVTGTFAISKLLLTEKLTNGALATPTPDHNYIKLFTAYCCTWHDRDIGLCHPDKRHNLITKSSGWLSLSHPYDLAIGSISSGWFMGDVLSDPDDIRSFQKSSGWHDVGWILCHPDEIAPGRISSRRLMTKVGCHPDDLWY